MEDKKKSTPDRIEAFAERLIRLGPEAATQIFKNLDKETINLLIKEMKKRQKQQKQIVDFTEGQPEEVTQLIKTWIKQDKTVK